VWIDQSSKFESHLRSVPLTDATKDSKFNEQRTNVKSSRKRTLFDLSDDDDVNYYHDEVIGDETEDAEIEVPKNFMYGPIAFCLPQEMQYLNGGAETVNIQKGRQLLRLSNASIGMSNSANAGMYHGMGANGMTRSSLLFADSRCRPTEENSKDRERHSWLPVDPHVFGADNTVFVVFSRETAH